MAAAGERHIDTGGGADRRTDQSTRQESTGEKYPRITSIISAGELLLLCMQNEIIHMPNKVLIHLILRAVSGCVREKSYFTQNMEWA